MKKLSNLSIAVLSGAVLTGCSDTTTENKKPDFDIKGKPNVVILTWHDAGRWFGCYGNESVSTPNIDTLASEGMQFTNYYSTSSICSPSRVSMLTGKYPPTHGVKGLCHGPQNYSVKADEHHLSKVLRDAGYYTVLCGWQHETTHNLVRERLGFKDIYLNDPLPPAQFVANKFDSVISNLKDKEIPFYAQVGFFESHVPFDFGGVLPYTKNGIYAPPYLKESPKQQKVVAQLQGAIHKADSCAGIVFRALEKNGLTENTIVVFAVDHGVELKRAKATLYDPGIEVPLIIRWPNGNITGGKKSDILACHADFYPTLLDLLGIPIQDDVQGISFAHVFTENDPAPIREDIFCSFQDEIRCVRNKKFKLIRNFAPRSQFIELPVNMENPKTWPIYPFTDKHWPLGELYDLENDPNEFNNLYFNKEYADVRKKLTQRLWEWMEFTNDGLRNGTTVTPWYERELKDIKDNMKN